MIRQVNTTPRRLCHPGKTKIPREPRKFDFVPSPVPRPDFRGRYYTDNPAPLSIFVKESDGPILLENDKGPYESERKDTEPRFSGNDSDLLPICGKSPCLFAGKPHNLASVVWRTQASVDERPVAHAVDRTGKKNNASLSRGCEQGFRGTYKAHAYQTGTPGTRRKERE